MGSQKEHGIWRQIESDGQMLVKFMLLREVMDWILVEVGGQGKES